ncbi:hypothetical protein IHE55_11155 [Streptomyces pactum]|uniref:Glycoprotein n=1 Tax=Streptomyces pactum TaxID=68249 RepID=A0ABS0NJE7_9ACTN|nr:DUF6049 family protein [Streptomyces pactum]MBH5335320.1 hypothetical protein [Streptomyces pactum]
MARGGAQARAVLAALAVCLLPAVTPAAAPSATSAAAPAAAPAVTPAAPPSGHAAARAVPGPDPAGYADARGGRGPHRAGHAAARSAAVPAAASGVRPSAVRGARRAVVPGPAFVRGPALVRGPVVGPAPAVARGPAAVPGEVPGRAAARAYPVRVVVRAVTPAVPGPGDATVAVAGVLTNRSGEDISGARLAVRLGPRAVRTRSEVAAVDAGAPVPAADAEPAEHTRQVGTLKAGARREFRIRVPVGELEPAAFGAYPVSVALTGRDRAVHGLAHTFLPRYPATTGARPLRTTVLWPLTDVPRQQALTVGAGEGAEPVFGDDTLAESLAPGGRLRRLVDAGRGRAVTWLIDPDLIVQAAAMADGYRVARTPGTHDPGDTEPGKGRKAAADWLRALRAAVRGREVVALPYADPDLASLAHYGRGALAAGSRRGADILGRTLRVRARQDLAWPERGVLDTSVTRLAERLRMRSVLTSGEGLSGGPDHRGATDDGPVAVGGGLTALTYDTTLAGLLGETGPDAGGAVRAPGDGGPGTTGGSGATGGPRTAGGAGTGGPPSVGELRQRLLAETLTAVGEAPNASRALVVLPPRRMSGTAARALATALTDGTAAGWLEPVSLAGALREPVPGRAGEPGGYPTALRDTELPPRLLAAVARDAGRARTLVRVLADPERTEESVRDALARSVSTAWRGRLPAARGYVRGTSDFLRASIDSVRLVPKSTVTVAGDSATIPVTVENALQQSVAGIEVRVVSDRPERLTVVDGSVPAEASRTASRTVRVEVRAHANGPVRLTARLHTTADGLPWGEPITFRAEVRSVSSGAVTIVAGGALLIVLAVVFQLGRARRRHGR